MNLKLMLNVKIFDVLSLCLAHRVFSLPWDLRKFLSLCCDRNATSSLLVL